MQKKYLVNIFKTAQQRTVIFKGYDENHISLMKPDGFLEYRARKRNLSRVLSYY